MLRTLLYPGFGGAGVTIRVFRFVSIGIDREMRILENPLPQATLSTSHSDWARKADVCAKVLAEGRRLIGIGHFATPLHQLVLRASDLLDDLDEMLVALGPVQSGGHMVTAAALHQELEHIQAAIPTQSRGQAGGSRTGSVR